MNLCKILKNRERTTDCVLFLLFLQNVLPLRQVFATNRNKKNDNNEVVLPDVRLIHTARVYELVTELLNQISVFCTFG